MKRVARIGVSVSPLLLLIALIFSWRFFLVYMRTPRCCVFSFDNLFSDTYKQEIADYAQTLDVRLASDPESYVALFKGHFSFIAAISTQLAPSGVLHIAIEGAKPLCRINDDQLLLDSGEIGRQMAYDYGIIDACPQLFALVDDLTSWQPEQIINLYRCLSTPLYACYDIWLSKYPELMLSHKQQQKLTLFARANEFDADTLVLWGEVIKETLECRGSFLPGRKKKWIADMRFHEQVVLVAK